MKISNLHLTAYWALFLLIALLASSCRHHNYHMTAKESAAITDSVNRMTANISRGLAAKGPVAWLDYFDDAPQFFMISDGQLSFHDYLSAKTFIQDTLVKNMTKIVLRWKNMRVDPLSRNAASICSGFHEDITMANGQTLPFDGYFSGTAIITMKGWRLINLHWSTPKPVH